MSVDSIIIFIIVASLILAFGIGCQDETMATAYGSGSLKIRWAMILGVIMSIFGVIVLSKNVGKTIGSNLLTTGVEEKMVLAILLSTAIWLIIAVKTHLPVSTTHTVVGSIFGVALLYSIINNFTLAECLNFGTMGQIFLGWFLSPLLGYYGAIMMKKLILPIMKKYNDGLNDVEKVEGVFRYIIIIAACINQFSRAGNDAGNSVGIYLSLAGENSTLDTFKTTFIILSALIFALGLYIFGKKLVINVGQNTTGRFRPSEALAVMVTTAVIIFTSTLMGLPVSGGHVLIFAMIGYAKTRGEKPNLKNLRKMVIYWILTFPMAALFSFFLYGLILIL